MKRNLLIIISILFINALQAQTPKASKPAAAAVTANQNKSILGIWICEKDRFWKLVFTEDNKCKQYIQGVLTETDSVVISNTSPQCGEKVPIDSTTSYLQFINIADTSEHVCYEINGITSTILSIGPVWTGGTIVFERQTH